MKQSIYLPIFISLLHFPILFFNMNDPVKEKPPRKQIVIKTIHLLDEPIYKPAEQKFVAVKEQNQPFKEPVKPAKVSVKPVIAKPVLKISKKNLQKKLQQSIAKSKSTPKAKEGTSKKIVKNDAGNVQREYNEYLQQIFEILSDSLTLPEQGKVKLVITVGGDGKVIKIETLSSESSLNLSYLQQNVCNLTFPKYTKKEDRTFTIVFTDEK